jgi:RHS repeat-associated protein
VSLLPGQTPSTFSYFFDFGANGGPGIRTELQEDGSGGNYYLNDWITGNTSIYYDPLHRIISEGENYIARRASTGTVTNVAYVTSSLTTLSFDNRTTKNVDYDPASTLWRTVLQLPYIDGFTYTKHIVRGYHPSGIVTGAQTNQYANQALDLWTNAYDAFGNYTFHKLKKHAGTVVNGNTLTWDAAGRLIKVANRDDVNDGFDWTATYDGLGRRERTIYTPIIGGVSRTNVTLTLDSWYDPQATYLEIGVAVNGQRTWKIYGPDISQGSAMQGLGGLEATIREYDGYSIGIINDYFGNGVAMITNGVATFGGRVTSYGPLPLQDLPLLSANTSVAESTVWRGKRIDPSGFYFMGARYYDPNAGRFISPDPLGHAASIDLYSAFGGDGVNNFDPDGMCLETTLNLFTQTLGGIGQGGAIGYDMVAQTAWSLGGAGGEYQGASDLYNKIYDNPNSGPTAGQILTGTLKTDVNIGTLGLYGMAQGFINGAETGDYSQAQNASLNALLLSAGAQAMQGQGINPYGVGYSSSTAAPTLEASANPNILSGHGGLLVGDSSPVTTVPQGTSITFWTAHGNGISDALGNAIETGAPITLARIGCSRLYTGSAIQPKPQHFGKSDHCCNTNTVESVITTGDGKCKLGCMFESGPIVKR